MNKQQLAAKIWESANRMRGKVDASEYKDFILGFIFYKYLSEKEEQFFLGEGMTAADMEQLVEEDEETGEPKDVDADDEEYGLVIMKAIQEDGEELLSTLDSDEELDAVYELFMERFFQDEDEEAE